MARSGCSSRKTERKTAEKNTGPEPVKRKKLHQARHQMQQNAQPERMHQHGTSRKTAPAGADAADPAADAAGTDTPAAGADAAEREKATAQQNGTRTRGKYRDIAIHPQRGTAYKASHRRQEDIKKAATNGGKKDKKRTGPEKSGPDAIIFCPSLRASRTA